MNSDPQALPEPRDRADFYRRLGANDWARQARMRLRHIGECPAPGRVKGWVPAIRIDLSSPQAGRPRGQGLA